MFTAIFLLTATLVYKFGSRKLAERDAAKARIASATNPHRRADRVPHAVNRWGIN